MPETPIVHALSAGAMEPQLPALCDILLDCVEGGASVSFMAPLTRSRAESFWRSVLAGVAAGTRIILVAERDGEILGTAQLDLGLPENQPHRADVAKVLVHRRARRLGLGRALMTAIEAHAKAAGRTLLVLDTVSDGDGERLYAGLGWTRVGRVPGYALFPDGRPCDTTIFYKTLA